MLGFGAFVTLDRNEFASTSLPRRAEVGHVQVSRLIPASISEAFQFLSNPENVPETVAGFLQVEFPRTPPRLEAGIELEAMVSRYGIAVRAVFRIDEIIPDRSIAYRQVAGFLRSWEHSIALEEHDARSTRLTESARFRMPLGIVGSLIDDVFVRAEVQRAFEARQERIAAIFGEPLDARPSPTL